MFLKPENFF